MIALGSDHGGYALKEEIKKYLTEKGIPFIDFGTDSEESCDYPEFAEKVCRSVLAGESEKGILCCGTGIGMSMAANKIRGIRCALCSDGYSAEMTRRHNDANVLSLGGRVVGPGLALEIVEIFLRTPFEGGRHARRVSKVMALEQS
ncbi:MAG: ribose 5-phosphate isomerase B [Oscillospiraceae bacterium]|nr:ribose 5-phosphate isomerase B [Oscillospiraceae bacterium]